MTELQALLVLAGCMGGLFLLAMLWLYIDNRVPLEDYDERQQFYQCRAFRFSYFVGFLYYTVVACIMLVQRRNETVWIEPDLLVLFGLELMACSHHFYCLLTHSALPLGDKGVQTIISYALMGTYFLLKLSMGSNYWDGMPLTGDGCFKWFHLTSCLTFYVLMLMHLFVRFRKEKEE